MNSLKRKGLKKEKKKIIMYITKASKSVITTLFIFGGSNSIQTIAKKERLALWAKLYATALSCLKVLEMEKLYKELA